MVTKDAGTSVVTPERSSNLPNTSYASLPLQTRNGSIVHVFFLEPTSLQLIYKAKRGQSTKYRCSACAQSIL